MNTKLDKIIEKFKSTDDYELELKYTDKIDKETYNKVIDFFKNKKLDMTETKTLDISFEYQKTNYRITIDDSQVDKYSKTNKLTKGMITEILIKQSIPDFKPLIDKSLNIKINIKEEIPVTDDKLISVLLGNLEKALKGFRYKSRVSFEDGQFRYDFTEVALYIDDNPKKSNSNKRFILSNLMKNNNDYELEIEIIDKDSEDLANEFLNEAKELNNLIIEINKEKLKESLKEPSKTKTKECPPDKIYNPETKRCVSKTGPIGKKLLKELASGKTSKSKKTPVKEPKEEEQLEELKEEEEPESKMEWMLPNRIGYNEKIFKTFRPENYQANSKLSCVCDKNSNCDVSDIGVNLYPQQRLIKDYVQVESPYRGAILYHELGSGKSGASIAAAEGYINKKSMFVLSPASLAVNYENEILKISSIGLNLKKDWTLVNVNKTNPKVIEILLKKYAISAKEAVKKDGLVWIPLYENDIPNATVIKTSVSEEDKPLIDIMISHIIRNRYTFISYNGLNSQLIDNKLGKGEINKFNNSFVIIDEVHNFASRVVNGSKLARAVYNKLMTATDCKIILLSGTPIINNPYEIATIVNLIRGYMDVYEFSLDLKQTEIEKRLKDSNLISLIDEYHIDYKNKKLLLSLLPKNYKKIDNNTTIIKKDKWNKNDDEIINEIMNVLDTKTKPNKYQFSALPNTIEEFNSTFLDITDDENLKVKNQDLFMRRILGTISYYSISGSDLFPKRLDDITRTIEMTDIQFKKYADVRDIERKMEMKKGGMFDDNASVYRAFSRMVCNFSFPENIKREYPNDIKKELKKEMDYDENEEITDEERNLRLRNPKVVDIYERKVKEAIDELIDGNYLTYNNVKKQLSPKFAYMYDDINESKGSVLVYSQFRTVEGLGLFSDFLKKNGFKEIDIKKVEGKYYFTDPNIFNSVYDNKRYIIFSSDKEKTRYLMNLFNGDFKNLPPTLIQELPKDSNQLYGKLVKLFCITASGAEGISLKNVRRVLITEPYWNNIRIEQVIGRAIRSCSHENLPLKDRDVQVFRYIMKFTKNQIDKNFTIQSLDKGISTDEHIYIMANKKMDIVNQFLQMLKASSFDCIINSKQNKPLLNGYKCYNWALGVNNDELSYTSDIKDDVKIMKHKANQILKKNKGKVVVKNGNKYVEMNGKIYNYYSYVNAGILIPEQI